MHDWILRLKIPRRAKIVVYVDDVAVVVVAKHLDKTRHMFEITFEQINHWMDTVNLLIN